MEAAIGVILLIVAIVGVILLASQIDGWSKRERGIPKSERKKLRKKNGKHEE